MCSVEERYSDDLFLSDLCVKKKRGTEKQEKTSREDPNWPARTEEGGGC